MDADVQKLLCDDILPNVLGAEVELPCINTSTSSTRKQRTKKSDPASSLATLSVIPVSASSTSRGAPKKRKTKEQNAGFAEVGIGANISGVNVSSLESETSCKGDRADRLVICEEGSHDRIDNVGAQQQGGRRRQSSKGELQAQRKSDDTGSQVANATGTVKKRRRIRSPIDKNDPALAAIDDEIDKVLQDKQTNYNLSAQNVKSIIHQVISNTFVSKMLKTELKLERLRDQEKLKLGVRSVEELDDDDYLPYEPKLTRSKAKELWSVPGSDGASTEVSKAGAAKCLWPISPAKLQLKKLDIRTNKDHSEEESTDKDEISMNLLMKKDLPPELDDSEDDEYVPSRFDTSNLSDEDCSSSTASVTSEAGSPAPKCSYMSTPTSTPVRRTRRNCAEIEQMAVESHHETRSIDGLFKTPEPPKRKSKSQQNDHAIGLRTRSKLPLNDTPIEHLEDQFIPPDITKDMYDWHQGTESDNDNEDYLAFLKSYWRPSEVLDNSKHVEDEEEADPEYNVMEDEDDDRHDMEELRDDRAVKIPKKELTELVAELFDTYNDMDFEQFLGVPVAQAPVTEVAATATSRENESTHAEIPSASSTVEKAPQLVEATEAMEIARQDGPVWMVDMVPRLTEDQKLLLQHQIRQHVQLLAQTFVLTDSFHKHSSVEAKKLIEDVWHRSQLVNTASSTLFSVCNIRPAMNFVEKWLTNRSRSPIKKKILEERCRNEVHRKSGFPSSVIKAIAESEAFCYPELLPEQYMSPKALKSLDSNSLTTSSPKKEASIVRTLKSEDAILIYELDKIDHRRLKIHEQADILAQTLPLTKSVYQIYHRLRNLHKSKNTMYQAFKEGILPSPKPDTLMWNPEEPLAPINKDLQRLPKIWQTMLSKLDLIPRGTNQISDAAADADKKASPRRPASASRAVMRSQTKVKINIYNKDPSLPISFACPKNQQQQRKSEDVHSPKTSRSKRKRNTDVIRRSLPIAPRFNPTLFSLPLLPKPEFPPTGYECQIFTICSADGTRTIHCSIPNYVFEQQPVIDIVKAEPEVPEKDKSPLRTPETAKQVVTNEPSEAKNSPKNDCTRLTHEDLRNCRPVYYDWEVEEENEEDMKEIRMKISPEKLNSDDIEVDTVDLVSDEEKGESSKSDDDEESIMPTSTSHSPSPSRSETSDSDSNSGYDYILPTSSFPYKSCAGGNETGDKRSQQNNSSNQPQSNQNQTSHGAVQSMSSFGNFPPQSLGDGDGDGEDDKDKSSKFNKDLSSDADENSQEEIGEDEEIEISEANDKKAPSDSLREKKSPLRKRKVSKSSPPNTATHANKSAKRSFKYNTTPIEELLETSDARQIHEAGDKRDMKLGNVRDDRFEDLQVAFVEAFISRARQRIEVEGKNPGLFNAFIQLLTESATPEREVPQKELFVEVEALLKSYPDLVREFTGIIDPDVASEIGRYTDHLLERSYFRFLELLERWTENCPQLKARILQKCRMLREDQNLTREKVVAVIDSYLDQNSVMIEAFKAMFPMFFCPESNPSDFEEIELDMDEKPAVPTSSGEITSPDHESVMSSSSDIDAEFIKLPEEANPVASSTCPCTCHENSTNLQFRNRVKHCNKCRIKFQDGKIYAISGRTMKPVDVQHTLPAIAKDILQKKVCSNCHKPLPRTRSSNASKEKPAKSSVVPAPANTCTCTASSTPDSGTLSDSTVNPNPICSTTVSRPSPVSHFTSTAAAQAQSEGPPAPTPIQPTLTPSVAPQAPSNKSNCWTIEEDRLILTTWNSDGWPAAAIKLGMLIPNRSYMEINERFTYLQKLAEGFRKT